MPSSSKRSAPQGSPEESPKNRISAKYSSNTGSSSVLSENNGITTTVIRSSTTPPAAGISSGSNDTSRPAHVLDNIPHADNRIFLGQKG
mgnify:CR=1 FL=1